MTARPHEVVWSLTNAVIPSRSLHVVAELGVADHIGDEVVTVKELAAACCADPDALDRVLALLATHGIFEARDEGYAHIEASRLLRTDHPMSMRAFAHMMALPGFMAMFDRLAHSVRTGKPAAYLVDPGGGVGRHPRPIRRAASPGARVLIIENVLAEGVPDRRGRALDVIMLAVTGGRERTPSQFRRLLEGAGFPDTTLIETAGPLRIVEAVAA